jgi:hypothetical protein
LDEDVLREALIRGLRARDIDLRTASEAQMLRRRDEDHLRLATAEGRVLFSFNARDYHRLHTQWMERRQSHAGVVLAVQEQHSIGELIRRLVHLASALSAEEMRNRIEFLGQW